METFLPMQQQIEGKQIINYKCSETEIGVALIWGWGGCIFIKA